MKRKSIVLAYSGGFDTTVAIPWLAERYRADVVTLTLDLGQEGDLTDVRSRALAAGALRAHVIDAREELVRHYILPALQAGAFDRGHGPGIALGHSLIASRLIDVARMEGAFAIAHGQTPGGTGALSRIDRSARAAGPSIHVIAAAREWSVSPFDKSKYAAARGISVPSAHDIAAENLWVRVVAGTPPGETSTASPDAFHTRTRSTDDCTDEPAYVEIEIDAGLPIRANGIEMPILELIESLDIIAGAHGVGRRESTAKRRRTPSEELCEAPAATVLRAAHAELEKRTLPRNLIRLKRRLGRFYADLIDRGLWSSPARAAIDGFVRTVQPAIWGSVRLKLLKGDCSVVSVKLWRAPLNDAEGLVARAEGPVLSERLPSTRVEGRFA